MRRSVIGLIFTLALGLLVAPRAAEEQPLAGEVPRVGVLMYTPMTKAFQEAFRQGLRLPRGAPL